MASDESTNAVIVNSVEKVVAEVLVQEHIMPPSHFDLIAPVEVGVILCFKKPIVGTDTASTELDTFPAMVAALKAALAKALVIYYPLAGELLVNSPGNPDILCNNRGVDVIEAYVDMDLRELNLYEYDSVVAKFLPKKRSGILCIQVTELCCGGMVVGCVFDHCIADAYSFNMFMSAWANIAKNQPIEVMPSFRGSLLSRRLSFSSKSPDPVPDQPIPPLFLNPPETDPSISRIYYINASDIAKLQEIAGNRHSKMVSFTAYLWQIFAKSACAGENSCSMGVIVDGRARMKNICGEKLMKSYYGNVLSTPCNNLQVQTLLDMKLADVADQVQTWISPALTEDHFLGLLDSVDAYLMQLVAAVICLGNQRDNALSCLMSSGRGFPEIDFGWGKAVFGSYHVPLRGKTGYVMPIPQPNTGDWLVYAHVAPTVVAAMEEEPTVFHKMTPEYFLASEK